MKLSAGLVVATILGLLAIDWVASVRGQVAAPAVPAVPQPPAGVVVEERSFPPSAMVRRLPGDPADREASSLRNQDYDLGRQADSLAAQYGAAKDESGKEKVRSQLRDLLNKQFDVHHKRREQELEKLEARVRSLREILNKRSEQRQTIVDKRLEQLVRDAEGLGWSGPGAGVPSAGCSSGAGLLGGRAELPDFPRPYGAPGKQPAARP